MKRPHHAGRTRSGGLSLNVFTAAEIDDAIRTYREILRLNPNSTVGANELADTLSDQKPLDKLALRDARVLGPGAGRAAAGTAAAHASHGALLLLLSATHAAHLG